MEPSTKPKRVPLWRGYQVPASEFMARRRTSRQRPAMKEAVELVMVAGVHVEDVAASMGRSRQNLDIGIERFIRTTETPLVRMSAQEFEFAAKGRRNSALVDAARLYLVQGYSVPEASAACGVTDAATKDLVKRMRARLRHAGGQPPVPGKGDVYLVADANWVWPTAEEIEALTTSPVVRRRSQVAYERATLVLVNKLPPTEVARLTNTGLQFVLDSTDKVVDQLNRYRAHMHFPKTLPYLVAMRQAVARRVTQNALRLAVEHYFGVEADLEKAAAATGVHPEELAKAVRVAAHEMARMAPKEKSTKNFQNAVVCLA